ncbi:testis-expressed protein 9-like [Xenia sp. Carnegie-2017]|uniref:testis-expressed protein 9-like n=1 Tax=Xenia sp. Carnegie-2017 TaxID=2897299 RepID=UPI001F04A88D|nr:testis-expressed protein 9-like [Xenia sp. Carnegie-2017]XP_046852598.1 testis-expressed protein 9-like [Xenia sp. Carnegie-2017]
MASKSSSSTHLRSSSGGGTKKNLTTARDVRPPSGKSKSSILNREHEYLRLNAELEAKTASLIKEAESVLHDQDKLLSIQDDVDDSVKISQTSMEDMNDSKDEHIINGNKNKSIKANSSKEKKRPTSGTSLAKRPRSGKTKSVNKLATKSPIIKIELEETEDDLQFSATKDDILEDNEDLSSEAVTRFLKAKIRVMQEELDRLSSESISKDENIAAAEQMNKELKEELLRNQKTNQSLQAQSDKYKKLYDDSKQKCDGIEAQLLSLRKELDNVHRDQKQVIAGKNALEVRLNRALEEVEKHKTSLQRARTSSKDTNEQEKKRSDQLIAENKRLEKQKSELMAAFKKQMKLIDILKRQKMHIEAARMLSFTEDEFVKALDWKK